MLASQHADTLDNLALIAFGVTLTLSLLGLWRVLDWVNTRVDRYLDRRAAAAAKAADGTRTFAADWIPQVEDVADDVAAIDERLGRKS